MKNKIHYICFYADEKSRDKVIHFPSSLPKINYISKTLKELDFEISILSTCSYKPGNKSIGAYYNRNNIKCCYLKSCSFIRWQQFATICAWLQIMFYICFRVKKNDKILLYHSLFYIIPINLICKIKKINLIIEIEELYYSLFKRSYRLKNKELAFLQKAKSYLLVNDLLKEKIDITTKPYVISYSSYNVITQANPQKFYEQINVVYAGVIEQHRNAAFLAVQAAKLLPEEYIVHILGFGENDDIAALQRQIDEVNDSLGFSKVIFHGALYGEEYADFLSTCHIGINCHTYSGDIPESADCTFPSKVFVYLSHDMNVVSLPLRCLEQSTVAQHIYFAQGFSFKDLATVIQQVPKCTPFDGRTIIKNMDRSFKNQINKLFNDGFQI